MQTTAPISPLVLKYALNQGREGLNCPLVLKFDPF